MILGKEKTLGDIPPGVFCFPEEKQKTPSGILTGVFYFPRIIKTPNNKIFISLLVINENPEIEQF